MEHAAVEVLVLLLIGCVVGVTAHRLRLPYTLALVLAGIGLGFVDPAQIQAFELNAELLFTFLLPALLFEAALHLDLRDFARDAYAIVALAVPGVLLAIAVTAAVAWAGIGATDLRAGFGLREALLFASVIAATDPISVLALFRELGVERRLSLIVEGESLLNDGMAVVVFLIVAAVFGVDVGHGAHPHVEGAAEIAVFGVRTFFWMAGGGVLIGALAGGLATAFIRNFDDHLVEITVTTVVAYGSFLFAEELGCSGVLSTVTAGVVTGSYGTIYGMTTRTRLAVEDFWQYAAFVANTLVFLLVGVELQIAPLLGDWLPVTVAFVATLVGRGVTMAAILPTTRWSRRPVPGRWGAVLWWGGLRGSLSMVLVLGLPHDFAARELLIHLVFGVVSASLFAQGLTVAPLLARIGMGKRADADRLTADTHRVRLIAAGRALHALEERRREGLVSPPAFERLRAWYEARREADRAGLEGLVVSADALLADELCETLVDLLDVEREAIRDAGHADIVEGAAMEVVLREVDERVSQIRGGHHEDARGTVERVLRAPGEADQPTPSQP